MKNEIIKINQIIFQKYKKKEKIASGSYGNIFLGENISTKKLVAIKIEDRKNNIKKTLEKEAYYLYNLKGYGIPELITFGYSGRYNILIETLLGKSLYDINLIQKFTLKDVCMIGIQLIDRLEYIHSKFIIHCDIKPQNILLGKNDSSIIYICDFGISQKYRSSKTGKHINMKKCHKIYVTLFYSSINSLLGYQQSRRDDLESLGYMLIYLKNGLPWENIKFKNLDDYKNKILDMKKNINITKLCKGLPIEIVQYIKYVRKLRFEEKPNYSYLKSLFSEILFKINQNWDYNFSWNINEKINNIKKSAKLANNKSRTPNKNIFHDKYNTKFVSRNEKHSINKSLIINKDFSLINYWTNLAEKNCKLLDKNEDLEVENNYYINYI